MRDGARRQVCHYGLLVFRLNESKAAPKCPFNRWMPRELRGIKAYPAWREVSGRDLLPPLMVILISKNDRLNRIKQWVCKCVFFRIAFLILEPPSYAPWTSWSTLENIVVYKRNVKRERGKYGRLWMELWIEAEAGKKSPFISSSILFHPESHRLLLCSQ